MTSGRSPAAAEATVAHVAGPPELEQSGWVQRCLRCDERLHVEDAPGGFVELGSLVLETERAGEEGLRYIVVPVASTALVPRCG